MTFRGLEERLLGRLKGRLQRGELSERRVARLTGYTQPHIHNVLNGRRSLNARLADALLEGLSLTVEELAGGPSHVEVPVARGALGPRHRFPESTEASGARLFPVAFLARFTHPALLRVADEEDAMSPLIDPGDVVLLDRSEAVRSRPAFEGVYALSFFGQGALCRCHLVGGALVLVAENPRRSTRLPDHLPLARRDILEVVRGRAVWSCREIAGPGDPLL